MSQKLGISLVLTTAIISGFSIFINKFGVRTIDSSVYTFLKNSLVALVLFGILLIVYKRDAFKLSKKQWLQLTLIGFVGGSIPFLLFFKGLTIASSASASFVHKTMFIFVAILAASFLKERINKWFYIGSLLLLVGNFFALKLSGITFGKGELLVFVAVLFWAVENTLSKYVVKDIPGTTVAFGRMFFGSLFVLVWLAFTGKVSIIPALSSQAWLWVVISDVFLVGFVLTWYNGIRHIPISLATCILLLGSPITTLLNVFFAGYQITPSEIIGFLLLAAGLGIVLLKVPDGTPASA